MVEPVRTMNNNGFKMNIKENLRIYHLKLVQL